MSEEELRALIHQQQQEKVLSKVEQVTKLLVDIWEDGFNFGLNVSESIIKSKAITALMTGQQ